MTDDTQNFDLTEDEKKLFEDTSSDHGSENSSFEESRRHFLKMSLLTGGGMLAFQSIGAHVFLLHLSKAVLLRRALKML